MKAKNILNALINDKDIYNAHYVWNGYSSYEKFLSQDRDIVCIKFLSSDSKYEFIQKYKEKLKNLNIIKYFTILDKCDKHGDFVIIKCIASEKVKYKIYALLELKGLIK